MQRGSEERTKMCLSAAKSGDEHAVAEVALFVCAKYMRRIGGLYSADPAYDREDLERTFMEAVLRAIPNLDERGDPLYHLGQRGVWAVQSLVRAARRQRHGVESGQEPLYHVGPYSEELESLHDEDGWEERIDGSVAARAQLRRIVEAAPEHHETLACMITEDVTSPGFNQRLAKKLHVSPQTASRLTNSLRDRAIEIRLGDAA